VTGTSENLTPVIVTVMTDLAALAPPAENTKTAAFAAPLPPFGFRVVVAVLCMRCVVFKNKMLPELLYIIQLR
jgi:hypothetical protein